MNKYQSILNTLTNLKVLNNNLLEKIILMSCLYEDKLYNW